MAYPLRLGALLAIATTLAAVLPAGATPPQAIYTVDLVKPRLRQLDGRTIVVRGRMDECKSLVCQICTEERPGLHEPVCLGIDLASLDHASRRTEADLAARRRAELLTEQSYRFASITVKTLVDGSCELGRFICTDRAATLVQARVQSVERRRAAPDGLWHHYLGAPLKRAPDSERDAVLAAYSRVDPDEPKVSPQKYEVFRDGSDLATDVKVEAIDWVCYCLEATCHGRWPTYDGHLTKSPANPYSCVGATLLHGEWRIEPS